MTSSFYEDTLALVAGELRRISVRYDNMHTEDRLTLQRAAELLEITEAECLEQARLNGMGAEREAGLHSEIRRLRQAAPRCSVCADTPLPCIGGHAGSPPCEHCHSRRIRPALPVPVFGRTRTVFNCLACGHQWHHETP